MGTGQQLYRDAKRIIPGGTQLLSKRPEQFLPEHWPAYYSKAQGCAVWDLDGREYLDFCYMGIGACILGYADPDVNAAVMAAMRDGNMCTLNAPEEVELARLLLEIHPWAQMVRFARTGGEAMSIAVRIARAATKREKVLFCGYHGWHDWYLAANLSEDSALDGHLLPGLQPSGVPRDLKGSAYPFNYNNLEEFEALIRKHQAGVAAVVMEPIRNFDPDPGFIAAIRRRCDESGIALIVDEITAGFRLNVGGAHLELGLAPDIAVFAKAMSNGVPMAAIIGKAAFMDAAQGSFISSTYWTERNGPAAALATIRKAQRVGLPGHLKRIGTRVMDAWEQLGREHGLVVHTGGIPALGHFSFGLGDLDATAKTVFTQEMLKRGFLATTACYVSLAHTDGLVDRYLAATGDVFATIARAVRQGRLPELLDGPVCQSGFKRIS
jgi:glutamate-1-semialdehyde 2,1-aminomutase